MAISHVSRTERLESVRYSWSIGREAEEDIAPIASAAYLIGSSTFFVGQVLGLPYLMSDHWIFGGVPENAFEDRERRWFLHLAKTVGQFMLE
jgi:hypothetical protein